MATFAERLKELRKQKGITQEKLAEKFFITKSAISKYETGVNTPENKLLQDMADFFEVSVDYLLGNTDVNSKLQLSELFSGVGGLKLDTLRELLKSDENNNNILFSIILEDKLKESNLYYDNMSYEEKVRLANKIMEILKLINKE